MNTKLGKVVASVAAGVILTGVIMAVPAGALPGLLGTPKAAAACTGHSVFKVVWSSAGVYRTYDTNSKPLKVKHSGDIVTGPSNSTQSGWTVVDYAPTGFAYMRDAALKYQSCY